MSKKQHPKSGGLVYSTNQDFFNEFDQETDNLITLTKEKQKLRVQLDNKQRAGKVVSLISGFVGTEEDLEYLAKQLKTKCGAGGSVKDGNILIQGDYKIKIIDWLKVWGYILTK
jgi:translation initiation factor 1